MIDVLEQIDFLKSLLGKDTPTHIKESIEKRIAKLNLDVLTFEHAHMSEEEAKVMLLSRKQFNLKQNRHELKLIFI